MEENKNPCLVVDDFSVAGGVRSRLKQFSGLPDRYTVFEYVIADLKFPSSGFNYPGHFIKMTFFSRDNPMTQDPNQEVTNFSERQNLYFSRVADLKLILRSMSPSSDAASLPPPSPALKCECQNCLFPSRPSFSISKPSYHNQFHYKRNGEPHDV